MMMNYLEKKTEQQNNWSFRFEISSSQLNLDVFKKLKVFAREKAALRLLKHAYLLSKSFPFCCSIVVSRRLQSQRRFS